MISLCDAQRAHRGFNFLLVAYCYQEGLPRVPYCSRGSEWFTGKGEYRKLPEGTYPESLYDKLSSVADLGAKHIADKLTSLFHFRDGQRTVDLLALAARSHHTRRLQDGEVLRYVGSRDT
jgi:hypothetical protein